MTVLKEIIYKGCNNTNSVRFEQDLLDGNGSQPVDFSSATRYEATLLSSDTVRLVVDTDQTPGVISGGSDGVIKFTLKDVALEEGEYFVRLKVYDAAHTAGQILVHEDRAINHDRLIFSFRDS